MTHFSEAYLGFGNYANDKIEPPARLLFGAYLDALIDNVNDTGALPRNQRLTILLLLTISQWEASLRAAALAANGFCRIAAGRVPAGGTPRNRATKLVEQTMMSFRSQKGMWEGIMFGRALDDFEKGVVLATTNKALTKTAATRLLSFIRSVRGRGRGGPAGTRPLALDRLRNSIQHGDFDVRPDGGIDLDVAHTWHHWLQTGTTRRVRTMSAEALADNLGMARGLTAMVWGFNNAVGRARNLP